MVLGPFAETKGPRLPGRDPAEEKGKLLLLPFRYIGNRVRLNSRAELYLGFTLFSIPFPAIAWLPHRQP